MDLSHVLKYILVPQCKSMEIRESLAHTLSMKVLGIPLSIGCHKIDGLLAKGCIHHRLSPCVVPIFTHP